MRHGIGQGQAGTNPDRRHPVNAREAVLGVVRTNDGHVGAGVGTDTNDVVDAEAKNPAKGIKGLVIDLRGNPGGLLETAAEMLSRFVENKTVLTMKKRDDKEVVKTYSGAVREWPYKIAILMDENSASAAEIFACTLKTMI